MQSNRSAMIVNIESVDWANEMRKQGRAPQAESLKAR